jgi:hypothetical protein
MATNGRLDIPNTKTFTKQVKVKHNDGSVQVVDKENMSDSALESEIEAILSCPSITVNGDVIKKKP